MPPRIVALAAALAWIGHAAADSPRVSYTRQVRPILSGRCYKCHGPAKSEAGLRLDRSESATATLDSGARAIVPGRAAQSALVARIRSSDPDVHMPPADETVRLTDAEAQVLERWIDEGADFEAHWAYLPPERPAPPPVHDDDGSHHPIDRFLRARMEREGLVPAPEADRETLLRRLSLDLVGLPPTAEERAAFLRDDRPDAYERLVDRLLASPHYGVRQSIEWLDLARYADSDGFPHDLDRPIWPYRDWVVEALNADMPYDRFTVLQLAGDLVPGGGDREKIASAFHRNTRINTEAGVDPEEYRFLAVVDRVNTTASVWLGATLGCAQCHDHKFDPLSQVDYYRFFAFFNGCADETKRDEAGVITNISPRIAFDPPRQAARRAELERRLEGANADERKKLEKELSALQPVRCLVMKESEQPRKTYVLARGSHLSPLEEVRPGFPSVLTTSNESTPTDRLALAEWIASPRNPLTARVAVNRLWRHCFGRGLVETPDDFGAQGSPPTHPELLDWLAAEYLRLDWRTKPLVRWIITSKAYRQSSQGARETLERDPANRYWARAPRVRLPAEVVRDNALAIGGLLAPHLGGPPAPMDDMRYVAEPTRQYRRSIYARWKRQSLDDQLINFDAPSRDVSCAARTRTNTPLQALNLLNDRVFLDAARGLAARIVEADSVTLDSRIDAAFLRALGRSPSESERAALADLHRRRLDGFRRDPSASKALFDGGTVPRLADADEAELAAWTMVAHVLLNLDETITRE